MGCDNQSNNKDKCTCTYTSCERRGNCCACVAYHRAKNQMVGCYFSTEAERTYDRSMKAFVAQLG